MRTVIIAMLLIVASQAWAECGNLCDKDWWATATKADVQAELDGGADVMGRDEGGETPLHWAAWRGSRENVQVLLTAGADVMARDKFGLTPLHRTAQSGNPANIKALLAVGADAKAKDEESKTPWDYAQENEKLKGTKGYWALNDAQYN